MKKRQTLAAILCFAFVFSSFTQFPQVKAGSTTFSFTSAFRINSPTNRTYTSEHLALDVSFDSLLGKNINHFLTYSLDGKDMGSLAIVPHYPDHLSFVGYFTASTNLPELSKGRLTITVYLSGATQAQMDTANVSFDISDTIPIDELTPPVISCLTLGNKTYGSTQPALNFTVDKAVVWTGYRLDGINSTVTDWWNTPESMRNFNATLETLTEGYHTLVVYAEDTFGNNGTSETVNFIVDTIPPEVSLLSIENKTYESNTIHLSFAVNEAASLLAYSIDGKENKSITGNATLSGLSNGVHNVTVYVWDAAGNIGVSATTSFKVKADGFAAETYVLAGVSSAAFIGAGLFLYFKKHKR